MENVADGQGNRAAVDRLCVRTGEVGNAVDRGDEGIERRLVVRRQGEGVVVPPADEGQAVADFMGEDVDQIATSGRRPGPIERIDPQVAPVDGGGADVNIDIGQ